MLTSAAGENRGALRVTFVLTFGLFVVEVAGLIILATGWYYADPIFSAVIGLFILPRTWRLLTQAVNVLLEGTPAHINVDAVRQAMLAADTTSTRKAGGCESSS